MKDLKNLVSSSLKTNLDEFLQLTDYVVDLLRTESGHVGNLRITGRLVEMSPEGNATIIGDLHGDLNSLAQILKTRDFLKKAQRGDQSLLIFLGDYGDRGIYSPEVYYVVLKLKKLFPERVILMRGNHEGPHDILAYPHDLPEHLNRKFGEHSQDIYMKLRELFDQLYNAVLISERCILLHGGAPSQATTIDDLAYAHKKHPHETHLEEILWNDPEEDIRGTYPSPRGAGKLFGEDITAKLLKMLNVKLMIRGHEPSENGFKINHSGKILTLFSRTGPPYFNRRGAYLQLNLSEKIESAEGLKGFIKFL